MGLLEKNTLTIYIHISYLYESQGGDASLPPVCSTNTHTHRRGGRSSADLEKRGWRRKRPHAQEGRGGRGREGEGEAEGATDTRFHNGYFEHRVLGGHRAPWPKRPQGARHGERLRNVRLRARARARRSLPPRNARKRQGRAKRETRTAYAAAAAPHTLCFPDPRDSDGSILTRSCVRASLFHSTFPRRPPGNTSTSIRPRLASARGRGRASSSRTWMVSRLLSVRSRRAGPTCSRYGRTNAPPPGPHIAGPDCGEYASGDDGMRAARDRPFLPLFFFRPKSDNAMPLRVLPIRCRPPEWSPDGNDFRLDVPAV